MRSSRPFFPFAFALALALTSAGPTASATGDPWKPLFDGRTLDGWTQIGGEADYDVQDGAIVGTSKLDTPNSFLTTETHFEDFILEFEFMLEDGLNSGVQFRSVSDPDYKDGRVHGYQFEIDASDRAWTAGIYDEARRGWLYSVDPHPEAKSLYRAGQWNQARIECHGDVVRTFLNGEPVAYLVDDPAYRRSGFIGLQVHSIGNARSEGKQIKWRNLRIADATPELLTPKAPDFYIRNLAENTLHADEAQQGWELLFDGVSTPRLVSAQERGGFPQQGWTVEEGELVVNGSKGKAARGGDIITEDSYGAFELQLEFKLTPEANSGIKYFVSEYKTHDGESEGLLGLEFQLLDDQGHPDAKQGRGGNRTNASLYDLIASAKKVHGRDVTAPPGQWNHARIVANPDGRVEHWLNGFKVLDYQRGSAGFRSLVEESKYRKYRAFGEAESGPILLQDHNDEVSFKSIKVRKL